MNKKEAKKIAKELLWFAIDNIKQGLLEYSQKDRLKISKALDEIGLKLFK